LAKPGRNCDRGRFSLVAYSIVWYDKEKRKGDVMQRYARSQSKSGVYHIMLRGNERKDIFNDDEDRMIHCIRWKGIASWQKRPFQRKTV